MVIGEWKVERGELIVDNGVEWRVEIILDIVVESGLDSGV